MSNQREEQGGKFHAVQAERDLEANWEVDLAKKLEDYLLKICSGEITGHEDESSQISAVNFAEAALLLQGSIQVYSRKVEYLYNLVLHALDFLSQKRQQEQSEGTSVHPEQSGSHAVPNEEYDQFWGLDEVPVDARNCLDTSTSKDASFYHFVKPPANLVVLEGDCLDTTGDGGELESYLLATNTLYRDFILLDPCDAIAVNDFLKEGESGKEQNSTYRGSSTRKNFQTSAGRSGGIERKSSLGKNQDGNPDRSPIADCRGGVDNCKMGPDHSTYDNFDDNNGFDMDDRYSGPENSGDSDADDDDDDPWKPLNPHEPGNLKVKPFKKVKAFRRGVVNSTKHISVATLFPLARMHGPISPELTRLWEERCNTCERDENSKSPSLYEKLRQSIVNGGNDSSDAFGNSDKEDNGYDGWTPDFGEPHDDMPEDMPMNEDFPFNHEKDFGNLHFENNENSGHGEPSSRASLEDLCRSHLDALLANIAENEKQTKLVARVSSWKQKIEHNLEEQDSRPPFDIHAYGERIVDKLSFEAADENTMSFADVVKGQEKHDVARTFSALLQLVNNGDIDLDRSGSGSVCFTAANPFHVRLLRHDKKREPVPFRLSKKRVKSPIKKGCYKAGIEKRWRDQSATTGSCQINGKFSRKLGGVRCTPEGKRRRKSRLVEPVDLQSTG